MTVVPVERTFGGGFIQTGGFKDKTDFVQRGIHGKVIYLPQGQACDLRLLFSATRTLLV